MIVFALGIFSTRKHHVRFINMVSTMYRQELQKVTIFREMTGEQLAQISPIMEFCQISKDKNIFDQGENANHLYILLRGEVLIRYKPYDAPPLNVAHIKPYGVFGWSSTLGREYYTSSASAVTPIEVYRISIEQLHKFCELYPETGAILLNSLANLISQKLKTTHDPVFNILSQGMDLE
jgi:CRP-like cAMP-binding protein